MEMSFQPVAPSLQPQASIVIPGTPNITAGAPQVIAGTPQVIAGQATLQAGAPQVIAGTPQVIAGQATLRAVDPIQVPGALIPVTTYLRGDANTQACPSGSQTITTEASCRAAAASLGLNSVSGSFSSTRADGTVGCFYDLSAGVSFSRGSFRRR